MFRRPEWKKHIKSALRPSTRFLKLFIPDPIDLVLTKMMRGEDAQDMQDIRFIVESKGFTLENMEPAFASVRIPEVDALQETFQQALVHVHRLMAPKRENP